MIPKDISLVVAGGSTPVGECFLRQLANAGLSAQAISRRPQQVPPGITAVTADLNAPGGWAAPAGATVISFLPLWILAAVLPRFAGAGSIIATGSTSLFSKAGSSDAHERRVAQMLAKAEEELQAWAGGKAVRWTLLRPTIIYDCKSDRNITRMAQFIRRWHFLPLAAPANGLRQPIHAEDVAKAAFQCINNPAAANRAFNISGGEVLPYRAMAERVFQALGKKPRFAMLPTGMLQKAFKAATWAGLASKGNFSAAVFERMNEDLVFDVEEGLKALNYQPRPFRPEFADG